MITSARAPSGTPFKFVPHLTEWFARKSGSPTVSGLYQTLDKKSSMWFNHYDAEKNIWHWGYDRYDVVSHMITARRGMSPENTEEHVISWRGLNQEMTA